MYNAGSDPEILFETWATVADTIRQIHCNHHWRSRMIHALEEMLRAHESYAWPEYLQQIYTLHQIIYATEVGSNSKTHSTVKDMLSLFSLTARQFRKDIQDEKQKKRQEWEILARINSRVPAYEPPLMNVDDLPY